MLRSKVGVHGLCSHVSDGPGGETSRRKLLTEREVASGLKLPHLGSGWEGRKDLATLPPWSILPQTCYADHGRHWRGFSQQRTDAFSIVMAFLAFLCLLDLYLPSHAPFPLPADKAEVASFDVTH